MSGSGNRRFFNRATLAMESDGGPKIGQSKSHATDVAKTFPLERTNKAVAAANAREIYLSFVAMGWQESSEGILNSEISVRRDC